MKFKIDSKKPESSLKDLKAGLDRSLTFSNQFESFQAQVEIPPLSSAQIRNELGVVPTEWIVVDSRNVPRGSLMRATTEWDSNYLHVYNSAHHTGYFTIRFFAGEHKTRGQGASTLQEPLIIKLSTGTAGYTIPNSTTGRQNMPLTNEDRDPAGVCSLSSNKFTLGVAGWWRAIVQFDNLQNNIFARMYVRNVTDSSDAVQFLNFNVGGSVNNDVRIEHFEVSDTSDEFSIQYVTGDASTTISYSTATLLLEKM